ncbi:hypothetical protein [Salinibacter ruber]|uniref:hypothetical protein n=1 Tax=Salinibacter ruber TaxID=146919 RepID=UPI00216A1A6A|nr:hypothetical protein [Salinibacter ruber]MCS4184934.1 hypothetical protein [Salinibacter ruber]
MSSNEEKEYGTKLQADKGDFGCGLVILLFVTLYAASWIAGKYEISEEVLFVTAVVIFAAFHFYEKYVPESVFKKKIREGNLPYIIEGKEKTIYIGKNEIKKDGKKVVNTESIESVTSEENNGQKSIKINKKAGRRIIVFEEKYFCDKVEYAIKNVVRDT